VSGVTNRRVVLAARPVGFQESKISEPNAGEFLVEARYLSADPLQRWRMEQQTGYGSTISLGDMVWGRMVGQVVRSRNADWREGDFAEGMLGWQEYAVSRGESAKARYASGVTRVDPAIAPVSTALGILGMPGVTAYFALLEIEFLQ
jgi:NADPH-dependent curcumin reductase CurA